MNWSEVSFGAWFACPYGSYLVLPPPSHLDPPASQRQNPGPHALLALLSGNPCEFPVPLPSGNQDPLPRLNFRKILAAAALLLAALVWMGRGVSSTTSNPVLKAFLAVTSPVQAGVHSVSLSLASAWGRYLSLVRVQKENEALLRQLAETGSQKAQIQEIERENARLRELSGLRLRTHPQGIGARVIARGASERFRIVRVDRGAEDGVRQGMAVLSPHGVVGQVVRVGRGSADVMLISDPLSAVGVVVQESRVKGVVEGGGGAGCTLKYVARSDQPAVPQGSVLMTSGEDGAFPAGLLVGRVGAVNAGPTGLFLDAVVEPAAPLDRLEELLILPVDGVVDPPPQELLPGLLGEVAGIGDAPLERPSPAELAGDAGAGTDPVPEGAEAPTEEDEDRKGEDGGDEKEDRKPLPSPGPRRPRGRRFQ